MTLIALFAVILFATVAMLWNEGLWSSMLVWFQTLFAALMATNYFEPLARMLDRAMGGSYTYMVDFLALWLIFAVTAGFLRVATALLSRYQVRFRPPVEMGGKICFSLLTGWLFICFTAFTLHTAPLAKHSFGEAFQPTPTSSMMLGLSPDRKWLGFVQSRSRGALSRWTVREFDPQSDFIFKYAARREKLESEKGLRVSR